MESKFLRQFIFMSKPAFAGFLLQILLLNPSGLSGMDFRTEGENSWSLKMEDFLQVRNISGKVTSEEDGQPMPGVNVIEKATGNGTVTDVDGGFSLEVSEGATLVFSSVGYVTREVQVGNASTLNVTLAPDIQQLEELVVIGYGTVKKSDLTGAVGQVTLDDANEKPAVSFEQLLQGRLSGVQITQSSGSPGAGMSFVVRGGNSLGSNQPLIVLDGYPLDAGAGSPSAGSDLQVSNQPRHNPLANLNPNEIESIEILKDASSTAIYGSRGANGVILITTKRGKKGEDMVEFTYRMDMSNIGKKLDVLSSAEFIAFANEAAANDGKDPVYTPEQVDSLSAINYYWQDDVYRTAYTSDYQIRFSGGDAKNSYSVSGSYLNNEGIVKNSNFNRGGVRLNYDRQVSNAFSVRLNMAATKTSARLGLNSNRTGLVSSNVISSALYFVPFNRAYTDDGEINQEIESNPLTMLNLVKDVNANTLLVGNARLELKLGDNFSIQSNIGANNNDGIRQSYYPRGTYTGDTYGGYAYRGETSLFNYLTENTLSYNKNFGESDINAVVGYTWQKWDQRTLGASASGFPNDNMSYESFQLANSPGEQATLHRVWALSSFLGRINYSLYNKYLFTVTGRADGSTRLAEGNKWAIFPSFALGWKIHEEPFMADVPFVSALKLRGSYGVSGNQSIGVGATKVLLSSDAYVINNQIVKGWIQNNIANPSLGWESTSQFNIGLDMGLFDDRVQFEVNYYRKVTDDLLINLPIPASTGFNTYAANSGSIENKGVDFDLAANVITNPIQWRLSGNISFNRNEVLNLGELGDDGIIFGHTYLQASNILNQPIHVAIVGKPVGSFYGYKVDGIYQNEEEVTNGPESSTATPGDFKFVDLNDDNIINTEDRTIIGNPHPDYVFGITNDIIWKNLSLSFLIQGVIGNDIANLNRYRLDPLTGISNNVSQEAYDNRWTGEGTSNYYPRPKTGNSFFNQRFPDFVIEDGSFVRLKNVNLSYAFNWNTQWVKSVTIFVSATNLLTFTDYKGYDPEVSSNSETGLTPGADIGAYPQSITFSTGANVKF